MDLTDSSNKEEVVLVGDFNGDSLVSKDIVEAITAKEVSNTNLDKVDEFECPAYMLDMVDIYCLEPSVMVTISNMLLDRKNLIEVNERREAFGQVPLQMDTALYIRDSYGIRLVGHGSSYQMFKEMEPFIKGCFGDKVKVYKNTGEGFKTAKINDVSTVRLKL